MITLLEVVAKIFCIARVKSRVLPLQPTTEYEHRKFIVNLYLSVKTKSFQKYILISTVFSVPFSLQTQCYYRLYIYDVSAITDYIYLSRWYCWPYVITMSFIFADYIYLRSQWYYWHIYINLRCRWNRLLCNYEVSDICWLYIYLRSQWCLNINQQTQ